MESVLSDSIAQRITASITDEEMQHWAAAAEEAPLLKQALFFKGTNVFLAFLQRHSPFLSALVRHHPHLLVLMLEEGIEPSFHYLQKQRKALNPLQVNEAALMQHIRVAKAQLALLAGVADILALWPLERVCEELSHLAAWATQMVCDYLLHQGQVRGEIQLKNPEYPSQESGVIILGMGKLGAFELNYSSDIDLMIFFEKDALTYTGKHELQRFFSKMALDMVRLLQERTKDGYVFRTDLRLRPDPSSTPPAISTVAALTYYETVGQNWERAAMIKARPIAGDIEAGERFLQELRPFIWRKYLDFAAIQDILSIKRQMHSKAGAEIALEGHHIKTGIGGIREIEFFAQVHQLIWGGRHPALRSRATCETLRLLAEHQLIPVTQAEELTTSYRFFRMVEHRLQMRADEQTHRLPTDLEGLENVARFSHFENRATFEDALMPQLKSVHTHFAQAFAKELGLGSGEGSLVFTGVEPDEATLQSLRDMGYQQPEKLWQAIADWHRGSRRATRTKRAREMITEITPAMLKTFAETGQPDAAFHKMDEFVERLPAGVQLFSLLMSYPNLLHMLAQILGAAPALADQLSRQPSLLDMLISADKKALTQLDDYVPTLLAHAQDLEDALETLCRTKQEHAFWISSQLMRQQISCEEAMVQYSRLAEKMLKYTMQVVSKHFAQDYGVIEGGQWAVLAIGRLGAEEMTPTSDVDLIFIYDAPDLHARSDGERSYDARVYYNRFCQRVVNALSTLGRYGRLYEVDARLRPSGQDGHLAVSAEGFEEYLREKAWTFEWMALTKTRAIAGDEELQQRVMQMLERLMQQPRDGTKIKADVADMRSRVAKEFPANVPLNLKYAWGGLLESDFLAQGAWLMAQPDAQGVHHNSEYIFKHLFASQVDVDAAYALQRDFLLVHRTCCGESPIDFTGYAKGTQQIILECLQAPTFEVLEQRLKAAQALLHQLFVETFEV